MFKELQLDKNVTKRESKWILLCNVCQAENILSYANYWYIKKSEKLDCKNCNYRPKKLINKRSLTCIYRNLFNQPTLKAEVRLKQRLAKLGLKGIQANGYVDGRTSLNKRLRSSDEYIQLRKQVFKRDNFTCQICFKRGEKIQMDHIKEWCNYPELRFIQSNCRTLCEHCHTKTPNYKRKAIRK